MKKSLLALVGVLFVGQIANADVRLQLNEVPTGKVSSVALKNIRVESNGSVILSQCQGTLEIPCVEKEIARFDADKMDEINNLIEEARFGKNVVVPSGARCFVAPFTTNRYTADNGKVFLRSGHLCLGWKANDSEAAKELVQLLQGLRSQN